MLLSRDAMKHSNSKLVWGIGINDTNHNTTKEYVNGKRIRCPIYTQWKDMLRRCRSEVFHQKYPTYIGCTVADEWIRFSDFLAWYQQESPQQGYQLDKDLLYPGNKVYSPNTCIFVPRHINLLLRGSQSHTTLPVGVYKRGKRFIAVCKVNSQSIYLGSYSTPQEAHHAYSQYKVQVVQKEINQQLNPKLKQALQNWIHILQQGEYV
jgi:hypothetical protein